MGQIKPTRAVAKRYIRKHTENLRLLQEGRRAELTLELRMSFRTDAEMIEYIESRIAHWTTLILTDGVQ